MYPAFTDSIVAFAKGPKGDTGDVSAADLSAAIAGLVGTADTTGNTLGKLEALIAACATLDNIANFSVSPTVPTLAPGNNSTKVANSAFVHEELTNALVNYLALAGGTMLGALILAADPSTALGAATKQYVDAVVQGISNKYTALCATTAALAANTYANGAAGVGATLTATANGAIAVDGQAPGANAYVLVKNEATAANNGLYTVTQAGDSTHPYILTRALDDDTAAEMAGAFCFVELGTTNNKTGWLCGQAAITIGTTAIVFTQFSGAGTYSAGTGLTLTGSQFSIANNAITYALLQQVAASSLVGNPTGALGNAAGITLGAALAFVGSALQTVAMTGDVTTAANSFATTIQPNTVSNTKLRQSAALSLIGNSTNATANVADIAGTANQVARVNGSGTTLGFGSIDLSQSAAVGSSILGPGNGGTGVNNGASTLTLAGSVSHAGAFTHTYTATASFNATFPSGTHTLAGLDVTQTWTSLQSFSSTGFRILGNTSGALNISVPNVAGSNTITLPAGTTDFSSTGGTSQVVKQTSVGGAFTVAQLGFGDLASGGTAPAFTLGGAITGGSQNITGLGTLGSGAHTVTSSSANALAVGQNGATNPTWNVDASNSPAGLNLKGAASGGTVALSATDSGSSTSLSINAKGTGTITMANVSSGTVTFGAGTDAPFTTGSTLYVTNPGVTAMTIRNSSSHVDMFFLAHTSICYFGSTTANNLVLRSNNTDAVTIDTSQNVTFAAGAQFASFTVSTLPAGATGKTVMCTNCRMFNGAGVQEGSGSGTGGLVTYNGTAWKIAGTNVTAIA